MIGSRMFFWSDWIELDLVVVPRLMNLKVAVRPSVRFSVRMGVSG